MKKKKLAIRPLPRPIVPPVRQRHPWTRWEYVNAEREELGHRVWVFWAAETRKP